MSKRKSRVVTGPIPVAQTPWEIVKGWGRLNTWLYSPAYEVPTVLGTAIRAAIQTGTVVLVLRALKVVP